MLRVIVLPAIVADHQILNTNTHSDYGSGVGQLRKIHFRTAQTHKELSAAAHVESSVKNAPLDLRGDLGLYNNRVVVRLAPPPYPALPTLAGAA